MLVTQENVNKYQMDSASYQDYVLKVKGADPDSILMTFREMFGYFVKPMGQSIVFVTTKS